MSFLGPILAFLTYNVINAVIRYRGLKNGYEKGMEIVKIIQGFNLTGLIDKMKFSASLVLGITIAVIFPALNIHKFSFDPLNSLVFLGLAWFFLGALKIKIYPTVIFYSIIGVAVLLNYIFK
jgi:hypothetical protein